MMTSLIVVTSDILITNYKRHRRRRVGPLSRFDKLLSIYIHVDSLAKCAYVTSDASGGKWGIRTCADSVALDLLRLSVFVG